MRSSYCFHHKVDYYDNCPQCVAVEQLDGTQRIAELLSEISERGDSDSGYDLDGLRDEIADLPDKLNNPGDYECPSCRFTTLKEGVSFCFKCDRDVPAGFWERIQAEREERKRLAREQQLQREQAQAQARENALEAERQDQALTNQANVAGGMLVILLCAGLGALAYFNRPATKAEVVVSVEESAFQESMRQAASNQAVSPAQPVELVFFHANSRTYLDENGVRQVHPNYELIDGGWQRGERPPFKTHDVDPAFPNSVEFLKHDDYVVVDFMITAFGEVKNPMVLNGRPGVSEPVLEAVRQWRFTPGSLHGNPVRVYASAVVPLPNPEPVIEVEQPQEGLVLVSTTPRDLVEINPVKGTISWMIEDRPKAGDYMPARSREHLSRRRTVMPVYGDFLQSARITGYVVVEAIVNFDGTVINPRILRSDHVLLENATVTAIRQWQFWPAKRNGDVEQSIITVTFKFSL